MNISIHNLSILKVPNDVVEFIKENFDSLEYETDTVLCYEGQVPMVALFLEEGEVEIARKRKIQKRLIRNTLLGCQNVLQKDYIDCEVRVKSGSRVYSIERSFLLTLDQQGHNLASFIMDQFQPAV